MSIPQSTEPVSVYGRESGMARVSSVHQLSLPGFVAVGKPSDHSPFRNPAFADNKNLPIHRWVPWIAGYSASFVDDVIAAYLPQGRQALVLDPFAGMGTTLLQAVLSGHHPVGFEPGRVRIAYLCRAMRQMVVRGA